METTSEKSRVLLVVEEQGAAARLVAGLGRTASVTLAASVREAEEALRSDGFDAVVLDLPPEGDRVASCAALRQQEEAPPLLLLDDAVDDDQIEQLLPDNMWPVRRLPRAVDAEKLAEKIREVLNGMAIPVDPAGWTQPCLPQILVGLRDAGETGSLEIRGEGVITTIHLDEGSPVFAEGGSLRETLGRMLLRRGEISEAEFVMVIDRMTERLVESEPVRMGEVLIELGLLGPTEVFQALNLQVHEKIVTCFQWRHIRSIFRPQEGIPESLKAFEPTPLEALIAEGVRTHFEEDRVTALIGGDWNRTPRLTSRAAALLPRLRLPGPEQRFLRSIDGQRSFDLLRRESRIDRRSAGQILGVLVVTGIAEVTEPARGPGDRVRSGRPARPDGVERVRAIRRPGGGARARPSGAPQSDEARVRLDAERLFRQGQALLEKERFEQAHAALAEAVRLQPKEPEYAMLEAWTAYLLQRVSMNLARAKARACAMRMARMDSRSARPHSILGGLALEERKFETALREFEAALVRDPEDRDAHRGIRRVETEGHR